MTKILNITYLDKPFFTHSGFLPISAGTHREDVLCDDTGISISAKNALYGELTAVYWAWKNLKNVDVIGTSHYRRYLMPYSWLKKTHYGITWEKFLDRQYRVSRFEKDLEEYDIVFCKKWHFEGTTIKEQFLAHHPFPEDLELTRNVLDEFHPEAIPCWDSYLSGSDGYFCCMFITKWNLFDDLCSWMFPMLFEIEHRLDLSKYDVYQQRMIAFLYERLLNVYLLSKNLRIKEYPFYFIDESANKSIFRQDIGARVWDLWMKIKK